MIGCVVCFYAPIAGEAQVREAVTIMGGDALCEDHLGYGTSDAVRSALRERAEVNAVMRRMGRAS